MVSFGAYNFARARIMGSRKPALHRCSRVRSARQLFLDGEGQQELATFGLVLGLDLVTGGQLAVPGQPRRRWPLAPPGESSTCFPLPPFTK